ncbi:pentatricopeptide repeat-containing protein At2g36240-like [Rosa rugosa]|uniref:pentatricopeptide repeat-containing protein At2g36240-like n=1 Tax=Rosa rugosa TaxID=74645 RepID=UPI002B406484|nr:pentatricopeptide repeat-containing protein At2g36240-like [Rosa rugosa]
MCCLARLYDYYGLVEVLCRKRNLGRALEVVDELWRTRNVPSLLIARNTLVEGLRRSARIDEPLEVMERMLEEGMIPDIVIFNCLLQDLCNLGRTEEADNLRLLSLSKGLELDGMAYFGGWVFKRREKESVKVVVDEMLDRGFIPDLLATYNRLVDG